MFPCFLFYRLEFVFLMSPRYKLAYRPFELVDDLDETLLLDFVVAQVVNAIVEWFGRDKDRLLLVRHLQERKDLLPSFQEHENLVHVEVELFNHFLLESREILEQVFLEEFLAVKRFIEVEIAEVVLIFDFIEIVSIDDEEELVLFDDAGVKSEAFIHLVVVLLYLKVVFPTLALRSQVPLLYVL